MASDAYKKIADWINSEAKRYNFQVAPALPIGKPGKVHKNQREYRLQLIDKHRDTSGEFKQGLNKILHSSNNIRDIKFNEISPNSSKFSSYSFHWDNIFIDFVIAKGANKGENFETHTVNKLAEAFSVRKGSHEYSDLIHHLNHANKNFAEVEIDDVKQRTGSTKKEGIPIDQLGSIIGDIVLTDTSGEKWYISLKDINGDTFSSYSGAATIFNSSGDLQPNSPGSKFLEAFGVNLNLVQKGFDERKNVKKLRKQIPLKKESPTELKNIFERAWGMNYFYVRKERNGWKVFWLDREKLNKLTSNIKVTEIKYPTKSSKQITIFCGNSYQKYKVEIRNSKSGEYPNDIKFKVMK